MGESHLVWLNRIVICNVLVLTSVDEQNLNEL